MMSPEINTSEPHSARVYDYWLGGKDNYAADQALGDAMVAAIPTLPLMARANRSFMERVTAYLAGEQGVGQFLDIGTGIPTSPNLHEVAQAVNPKARVVYVDNDQTVLAHARALLTSDPEGATAYIDADLTKPESILEHASLISTLDLGKPVALTMVAVLMYFRDEDGIHDVVSALVDALPSGSYVAITHPTADFDPEPVAHAVAAATGAGITLVPRTQDEVAGLFRGVELIEPGVVPVPAWRPDVDPADPRSVYYYAGVGLKP